MRSFENDKPENHRVIIKKKKNDFYKFLFKHIVNMAGTRLFYKLQSCDATDCTTNHFPKVLAIENNIVFHFDVMLIEIRLKQYFSPGEHKNF